MREELLAAIQKQKSALEHFDRRGYARAFKAYCASYGDLYAEAVRAAGEDLNALTADILDGLEAGWKAQHFWNRSAAKAEERQIIIFYLSPMLLEREEEGCHVLAELLRDGWEARWPKNAYQLGDYKSIRKGFHNVVLGVDLDRLSRSDDDEDDD